MKNIQDFVKLLESGIQPVVEFRPGILEKESYAEAVMRARAMHVQPAFKNDEEIVKIVFKFDEFDAHNKPLESANYYDKAGKPCLTAREANFYHPEDHMYFERKEVLEGLFVVVDDARVQLFKEYQASGSELSYVAWLEDRVLATKA